MTTDRPASAPAWHARPVEETLAALEASRQGLTAAEVTARLERHGRNVLPPPKKRGPLLRFLLQFHNVLIYVLLAAAVITAVMGHWVDSLVILGVVVINAAIGFIQEGKAEAALEAIRGMLSPHAQVLREGRRQEIDAADLVPGDIVYLVSGDHVPADLRLIEVKSLRVEEAALTGESVAVEKQSEPVAAQAPLGDRSSMAWSGTLVTYGQAGVLVAAILLGLHQLPINPVQILWVNMVTAVTLALALAFEPAERDIMRRPPRHPQEAILTPSCSGGWPSSRRSSSRAA